MKESYVTQMQQFLLDEHITMRSCVPIILQLQEMLQYWNSAAVEFWIFDAYNDSSPLRGQDLRVLSRLCLL